MDVSYRNYELPWTLAQGEELRFRRIRKHVLGVLAVLAVAVPFLPVLDSLRNQTANVPPRLAQLVLERRAAPPVEPPPPKVTEKAEKPEEPAAEKPKPVVEKPPASVPPIAVPVTPKQVTPTARERAADAGLMALADELRDLRENSSVERLSRTGPLSAAADAAPQTERSLLTASGGKSSGGINTAALSRDTGGTALAGRELTRVASPVAAPDAAPAASAQRAARSETRTGEEIERVFDRNKSAIYALYSRALRRDPGLEGKVVLELTIEASGKVSACRIVSSELGDAELERKLVQRIKLFDFGARDVGTLTTTKPIEFFPA